jgi:hypothetical protein
MTTYNEADIFGNNSGVDVKEKKFSDKIIRDVAKKLGFKLEYNTINTEIKFAGTLLNLKSTPTDVAGMLVKMVEVLGVKHIRAMQSKDNGSMQHTLISTKLDLSIGVKFSGKSGTMIIEWVSTASRPSYKIGEVKV